VFGMYKNLTELMLIDFRELFPRWDIKPTGVLHIGANIGEEAPVYNELGIKKVIWIEGNPELRARLEANIAPYPGQKAYIQCVGDKDEDTVLHISNNGSQSSSVLELGTHKTAHPEVHYVKDIAVKIRRLDGLFAGDGWGDLNGVDFLNCDLQGFEMQALKGLGELLKQFNHVYLEVNKEPLYIGCSLIDSIDLYLLSYGFIRRETKWTGAGWGDAYYSRRDMDGRE